MKLLLVSSSDVLKPFLQRAFQYQSAEIIHYRNPIKAMDNLDEIEPKVVLFSAVDFPRHWKPFVTFLRGSFGRRESVFVLLINEAFPAEEASKAEYLEVNAIFDEDLTSEEVAKRIRAVVTRYNRALDVRRAHRLIPSPADRIRFVFVNPYTRRMVVGRVMDLSTGGLRFEPEDTDVLSMIDGDAIIENAALRIGSQIVAIKARVAYVGHVVGMEFIDMPIDTEESIDRFLAAQAAQEANPTVTEADLLRRASESNT